MKPLTIQEVHTYQQLAEKDIVMPLRCLVNPDDHVGLTPNIYDDGSVYLYCLTCNSKLIPGLQMIKAIRLAINTNIQQL